MESEPAHHSTHFTGEDTETSAFRASADPSEAAPTPSTPPRGLTLRAGRELTWSMVKVASL